jgi:hypothetical protein
MNGDIAFNANSLQTYNPTTSVGIIVDSIGHESTPEKSLDVYTVANANKSAIAGDPEFVKKNIPVTGTIIGSSVADLAARVDAFKALFNGKDKNLDIGYAGTTRRYIATADNSPSFTPNPGKRWIKFAINFLCADPFGRDISATTLWTTKTGFTAATFTEAMTVGGSAPYQLPVFTITLTAISGAGDYVLISNDNNNQEILLYGLGLVAGDVIVIDCVARKVTVNGIEVDYYGTFLELEPGSNSITYTDGFTTRTVTVAANYVKRWQ